MLHNSPIPITIRKKSHWKLTSCKGTKKYHFDPDQSTKLSISLTIYAKIILKSKNVCFIICAQFLPAQYASFSKSTKFFNFNTGKSLSEALILGSTNPQYDKRLFIDLPVQYMKTRSDENYKLRTWGEHVVCINCSECQNENKNQFVCTTCSPNVLSM